MHTPEISSEELATLENDRFFRIKSGLDDKVKDLFILLKGRLEEVVENGSAPLPEDLPWSPGRRYQGENHHGFPWRALDFPRAAKKPDLLIFRCLLLYGHSFSFHLILDGYWKELYLEPLLNARQRLGDLGFILDSRPSAWEWFIDHSDLYMCSSLQRDEMLQLANGQSHLKLSLPIPLAEFSRIPEIGAEIWRELQEIIFGGAD